MTKTASPRTGRRPVPASSTSKRSPLGVVTLEGGDEAGGELGAGTAAIWASSKASLSKGMAFFRRRMLSAPYGGIHGLFNALTLKTLPSPKEKSSF